MPQVIGTTPQRLRAARESRNLSQLELANLVGVGQTAISQFETGRASPSLKTLQKIASSLQISIAVLIDDVGAGRES